MSNQYVMCKKFYCIGSWLIRVLERRDKNGKRGSNGQKLVKNCAS